MPCTGVASSVAAVTVSLRRGGLIAPVMMLIQSRAVFSILLGHDGGWQPQRRDDGGVPARDLFRLYVGYTLFGIVLAIVGGLNTALNWLLWVALIVGVIALIAFLLRVIRGGSKV